MNICFRIDHGNFQCTTDQCIIVMDLLNVDNIDENIQCPEMGATRPLLGSNLKAGLRGRFCKEW
jgi:hypothetical protein